METKQMIVKTFPCKTKETQERVEKFWKPVIQQYVDYYNKVSLWLANNLTSYTLGQIADILVKSNIKGDTIANNLYIQKLRFPENSNLKFYYLFKSKAFSGNDRLNILYGIVEALNVDGYTDNSLGIAKTYYRRFGYVKSVEENYVSKFATFKLSFRRRKINTDSTFDELASQYLYESASKNKTTLAEWEKFIAYIKENNFSQDYIERIETIVEFYRANQNAVDEKQEEFTVQQLSEFFKVGCQRNANKLSMSLCIQSYSLAHIENTNNFHLYLKKGLEMDVYGRKDIIKDNTPLIDLNSHTQLIVFSIKNNQLWVNPSFNTEIRKHIPSEEPSVTNTIGIDINTKHALMFTSLQDNNQLKGYVNIYKELLADSEIVSIAKRLNLYNDWQEHSKYVIFCPVECDIILGLYERMADNDVENQYAILGDMVYNKLIRMRDNETDAYKKDYISRVILVRTEIRSYLSCYFTKMKLQSEYDKSFNNQEELYSHPFRDTAVGIQIISKMRNIQLKLEANRNNIICYAYKLLQNNGFNYIALECLESSQSERIQRIPTPLSMLKNPSTDKTPILGLTDEELEKNERYQKFKDNYILHFEDGKVADCVYSQKGLNICRRSHLNNIILKAIHFADFKDKFVQLANNGRIQIALDNSAYTSLMDSKTNSVYVVEYEDDKGKLKTRLAKKAEVRSSQEKHINGLNADFNAACNIRNRIAVPTIREKLMRNTKNEYCQPMFEPVSKKTEKVIIEMKKIGRVITIQCDTNDFSKRKFTANRSVTAIC